MGKDILYPLRLFHGWLHEKRLWLQEHYVMVTEKLPQMKARLRDNPEAVILILTPAHSNMGDHAIAWSETELLRKARIPFIEITGSELFKFQEHHMLHFMNGRVIVANGGGYLGTFWFNAELALRDTLVKNPRSPFMVLPNTIFYEETPWGEEELKKSIDIYNAHPNLTIYAREKTSYEKMKGIYRDVRLMPDMVLSLDEYRENTERKGCMICLRSDCEKTRTPEQEENLLEQIRNLFSEDIRFSDMCIDRKVSPEERRKALDAKFDEFRASELVVTDRLHAMIFSAITGTPCIVVDSKSPKVRGCYEWIRHLDYIRFADDPAQIGEIYRQIPREIHRFDNSELAEYYAKLAEHIAALRK